MSRLSEYKATKVKSDKFAEANSSIRKYLAENRQLSEKLHEAKGGSEKGKRGTYSKNQIKNVFSNAAFNKVFEKMKPMIGSVVARYTSQFSKAGTTFDDLMHIGAMGLVGALKNYDPNEKAKFSTFAYPYIVDTVKAFVRDSNLIAVPRNEITSGRVKHVNFSSLDKETDTGGDDKAMTLGASLAPEDDKLRSEESAQRAADELATYLEKIEDPFIKKAIQLKLQGYSEKNVDKEGTIKNKLKNDPVAMQSPNFDKYIKNVNGTIIKGMEMLRDIARGMGRQVSDEKIRKANF